MEEADFRRAAKAVAERKRQEWLVLKAERDHALSGAIAEHATMPDNYWHAEHRAEAIYRSAALLAELLE